MWSIFTVFDRFVDFYHLPHKKAGGLSLMWDKLPARFLHVLLVHRFHGIWRNGCQIRRVIISFEAFDARFGKA